MCTYWYTGDSFGFLLLSSLPYRFATYSYLLPFASLPPLSISDRIWPPLSLAKHPKCSWAPVPTILSLLFFQVQDSSLSKHRPADSASLRLFTQAAACIAFSGSCGLPYPTDPHFLVRRLPGSKNSWCLLLLGEQDRRLAPEEASLLVCSCSTFLDAVLEVFG